MLCIPKEYATSFKQAIESNKIDVDELAAMNSGERLAFIKKSFSDAQMKKTSEVTGKETEFLDTFQKAEIDELANKFNRGFEQRMVVSSKKGKLQNRIAELEDVIASGLDGDELTSAKQELDELQAKVVARQQQVLKSFLDRELSRTPKSRRKDMIDKVKSVRHMLTPTEKQAFLEDLVAQKMGLAITEESAKQIAKLADEMEVAQRTLDTMYEKTTAEAGEAFRKLPDTVARKADAEKLTGAAKEKMLKDLEHDEVLFHNNVFEGKLRLDGTPTTKAEYMMRYKELTNLGLKQRAMLDYVGSIEDALLNPKFADVIATEGAYGKFQQTALFGAQKALDTFGLAKSLVGTGDMSVLFIQGFKQFITHPILWTKNVRKVAGGMYRVFKDAERLADTGVTGFRALDNKEMAILKAEIAASPNGLNGKYKALGNDAGLGVGREEQFPSSLPEQLPTFMGRAFKSFEYGFNAMSLRMRKDLADIVIDQVERQGADLLNDNKLAEQLGLFVGASTGRGAPLGFSKLGGKTEEILNKAFFSPRFVGSLFYTPYSLARFLFDAKNPVSKIAAKENAKLIIGAAVFMALLDLVSRTTGGQGVDWKPDSKTFGHLKVGDYSFDLTGGHSSLVSLVGRMWTIRDFGQQWDSKLGIYRDVAWGTSATDSLAQFFANKLSPGMALMRDFIRGYHFGEEELSWGNAVYSIMVPLSIQTYLENDNPSYAEGLALLLANGIGLTSKEMTITPMSKDWRALKAANPDAYKQAKREMNDMLWQEIEEIRSNPSFQKLPEDEQYKYIQKVSRKIQTNSIDKYLDKYNVTVPKE